jgi:glyoxylase-like metal-dependent hydrolase (beta-lactamase superfamily II)
MVTELADGVRWIDLASVNAYLVDDGGALTLVDAGLPRDDAHIIRALQETGHSITDVERVLVTHYDLDHVGALGKLGLDAPVYAGREDAGFLSGETKPPLGNHKGLLQRAMGLFAPTIPDVRPVEDGETVGSFTAYHTPGHTPGHTVYVDADRGVAFLGDLVREADAELAPAPWVISYDTGEVADSIRRLVDLDLAFEVAAMGHGTPFATGGSDHLAALAERL